MNSLLCRSVRYTTVFEPPFGSRPDCITKMAEVLSRAESSNTAARVQLDIGLQEQVMARLSKSFPDGMSCGARPPHQAHGQLNPCHGTLKYMLDCSWR